MKIMNTNEGNTNVSNSGGIQQVSQEEFLKIMKKNATDNKQLNQLSEKMRNYIKKIAKESLSEAPEIKTGIIRYNSDDKKIKVQFLDSTDMSEDTVWDIQNESIYRNLPEGTPVKVVFQKKNKYNNCWIIGVNNGIEQDTIEDVIKNQELYFYNQYIQMLLLKYLQIYMFLNFQYEHNDKL